MILAKLFLAFLRVGFFAIGGAYSFLPLIEKEVVEKYHWLTKKEFLDVLGISQVFPGAISIKYATYTGYKISGITGAIVANLGNLLSPALLIIFASFLYLKYKDTTFLKNAFAMIQLVMFSLIISAAFQVVNLNQLISLKSLLIVAISFLLFTYTKIHPAFIVILAGTVGILLK